jgi:hypothetical protein
MILKTVKGLFVSSLILGSTLFANEVLKPISNGSYGVAVVTGVEKANQVPSKMLTKEAKDGYIVSENQNTHYLNGYDNEVNIGGRASHVYTVKPLQTNQNLLVYFDSTNARVEAIILNFRALKKGEKIPTNETTQQSAKMGGR